MPVQSSHYNASALFSFGAFFKSPFSGFLYKTVNGSVNTKVKHVYKFRVDGVGLVVWRTHVFMTAHLTEIPLARCA